MNISRFFIDRPIFATVLSIVITVSGLLAMQILPISEYPEVVPPTVAGPRHLPRRQPRDHRRDGRDAAGGADQRCRGHALHVLLGDRRWGDAADRDLRSRHRHRHRAGAGPEPGEPGAAPAPGGGAPAGRGRAEELSRSDHGRPPDLAQPSLRCVVPPELRADPDPGRAGAAAGHGEHPHPRRRGLRHADLARSRQGRRAQPDRGGGGAGGAAAERAGLRRQSWGGRPSPSRSPSSSPSTPRAACSTRRSSVRW